MSKKTKSGKARHRYSKQYKAEALALAEEVGVPTAAKQFGLHESQLYSWRSKERLGQERWPHSLGQVGGCNKVESHHDYAANLMLGPA